MRFSSIFGAVFAGIVFLSCIIAVLQTERFAAFRNFRVISLRFAVFLCYSVRCLYVILCGFAVFVPPLRPALPYKEISGLEQALFREPIIF